MLSNKYLATVRNLQDILKKIVEEAPPDKFTIEYLKRLGFKSSNDYRVIRLLKDIWFLTESGNPTKLYHEYRNPFYSRIVLGQIVKEIYGDIFLKIEHPQRKDTQLIRELFKSTHGVSDQIALFMTNTFFALFELSDLTNSFEFTSHGVELNNNYQENKVNDFKWIEINGFEFKHDKVSNLIYSIELHLPLTKDKDVYDLIFSSLQQHLLKSSNDNFSDY